MNNTIYNDIKNIYKFLYINKVSFIISLILSVIIFLAASIYSKKFISEEIIIEFIFLKESISITKQNVEISEKKQIEELNKDIYLDFLNSLNIKKSNSKIMKNFLRNKLFKSDQYTIEQIDHNLSKQNENLVMIIERNIFTNREYILKNISEGIILNWNKFKKYRFNNLNQKNQLPKNKNIINFLKLIKTHKSNIDYSFNSITKINYIGIFLVFSFIVFNMVSIIMIKEILNEYNK